MGQCFKVNTEWLEESVQNLNHYPNLTNVCEVNERVALYTKKLYNNQKLVLRAEWSPCTS